MSINPSATNYTPFIGSYNNNQTAMFEKPSEGSRAIAASITWSQYPMTIVSGIRFNCQPQGPNVGLSQIGTLYVDNTQCAHNLTAYFPDTGHQIEINAFSAGFFPVVSNATNFILAASESQPPGVTSFIVGEVTLLQILNVFAPPSLLDSSPINVSLQGIPDININKVYGVTSGTLNVLSDVRSDTRAVLDIAFPFGGTGSNIADILNSGVPQVITGFDISLFAVIGGAGGVDGEVDLFSAGINIGGWRFNPGAANVNQGPYQKIVEKTGLHLACSNGHIQLQTTINAGSATSGTARANVYYH